MSDIIHTAFVGNPNCGKTSLFNAYTGAKLKVANWPGVTVEKKEGAFKNHDDEFKLVDLPGTYSLTSYTMEEKLARQYVLDDDVEVIVDVTDASSLERNLYLTLQLIELGKPVVLALNMMDIVEQRGMEIDTHRMPEMLGIPCIPVSARKKRGLDVLIHAVAHHANAPRPILEHHHEEEEKESRHIHDHHKDVVMVYSDEIEDKIDQLEERLTFEHPELTRPRWAAISYLSNDKEVMETYPIKYDDIIDKDYESRIINEKYDFIDEVVNECVVNKERKAALTDKADKLLLNRWLGLPIFLLIMAAVFFITFVVGDWLKSYFQLLLDFISTSARSGLTAVGAGEILTSLVVDGIIAGVGGILTFLPNIFILFLALAFLEDSGYMSRVAYVMDSIMGKIGLSGRAFIPMVLGFGCSVPAVMASRALESEHDRRKTILITPFMSCSARLPVYILLSEMFFGKKAMFAAFSMYLLGIIIAIISARIMTAFDKKHDMQMKPLLIELPEYKTPNMRSIMIYVWEKIKDYLSKAGTTIFIASIVVWLLMNFGPSGKTDDISVSFGAYLGRVISPLLIPCGFGIWQIAVALLAGIAAKEVIVSSLGILYSVSNINSAAGMTALSTALASQGFTSLSAYSMMIFVLLYVPCIATIATIKKETKSRLFTTKAVLFQLFTAWAVSAVVFQIRQAVYVEPAEDKMVKVIIIAVIAVIAVLIIVRRVKEIKSGRICSGCGGDCEHCRYAQAEGKKKVQEEKK